MLINTLANQSDLLLQLQSGEGDLRQAGLNVSETETFLLEEEKRCPEEMQHNGKWSAESSS